MKHTNIAEALGWEAAEDLQEGLFLQPEEAATVDALLATRTEAALATSEAVGRANELTVQLGEAQETIATQTARISELEAQVTELGSAPSGTGTTLTTTEDTTVERSATPSYLSDSAPENAWLDKQLAKKKAAN